MSSEMYVIKRNGDQEDVSFDKILSRIKSLSKDLDINPSMLTQKVIARIYNGVSTCEIDDLTAEICTSMMTENPDIGILASKIAISNHHKKTSPSFSETIYTLYNNKDVHGNSSPLISEDIYKIVMANKEKLNSFIKYERDYLFDFFGFKTLEKAYLMKVNGVIVERPQHMLMRVSLGIHGNDFKDALNTYDMMSQQFFIHATPTLYNAGTPRPQCSSCFLVAMEDDSIDGIYETIKQCALISKWSGGIGCHIHNIRSENSRIRGTNGVSTGIIPMLRVFNNTARYVNQGGKRNGSFAMYLEPWHADIEKFLKLKRNHGNEEERARDLFYALWIPDLFMKRVEENGKWTLMCPDECPGLQDSYGDDFEKLYVYYEEKGLGKSQINAQELWFTILDSQVETGTPYLLYKDHANRKSNQKNIGVIKSSNLCCEIMEVSNKDETAVCNLASIGLSRFVKDKIFDFTKLYEITRIITKNLNKVIDVNFYPIEKAEVSNKRHRPIGIGVQGLADVFILMGFPFDSDEAKKLNKDIFETIYYASLEESMMISKKREVYLQRYKSLLEKKQANLINDEEEKEINLIEQTYKPIKEELERDEYLGAYSSFNGSPSSKGILQYDMWNVEPSDRWDWNKLKDNIKEYGIRNSLLVAPMPTASTSQILGNNECIEPITSNIYTRSTLAGQFVVINKYLIRDLIDIGIWSKELKDKIIINEGSIQNIEEIPIEIKNLYKTVWDIKQKHLIDMAADRGAFVCQSQSLNLFLAEADYSKLTSMHFYTWKKGLKTGIYYLRTKPVSKAQQFSVNPELYEKSNEVNNEPCEMCAS